VVALNLPLPRLVLHHSYAGGNALDCSGMGHGGSIVGARFVGDDRGGGGLEFDGRHDRVVVTPSPFLRHITVLRVSITVRLRTLAARSNLVEGFLSFALFVHEDGSVQGGVYARSHWLTVRSEPGCVTPGRWATVSYVHSPADGSLLYVGRQLVGHDRQHLGTIGPVSWPFGLNIGAWPDSDAFMLSGRVSDLRLWVTRHGP
jgi:hypothetical protein